MENMTRRPIMGREELAQHKLGSHGRDYTRSDDGYSDMEVNATEKWKALSGWGADGWDLGDWPYLVISIRNQATEAGTKYQLLQVCEGDHDIYEFDTASDREAALDYLFLWYAAGKSWAPLSREQRELLDAGQFVVDEKFRGPYRARA